MQGCNTQYNANLHLRCPVGSPCAACLPNVRIGSAHGVRGKLRLSSVPLCVCALPHVYC